MARNITVITTDDLDGSEGAGPVTFSIDGSSYEIDLAAANRAKLAHTLAPFIGVARRVRSGSQRPGTGRSAVRKTDLALVRAWAREAGLKVSERGRISGEVMRRYEAEN
jgi:hypothetical protein